MKLYKVTYHTEVVILAKEENEAIRNAPYCAEEEPLELMDWELVESMEQIPKWKGCIPYPAKRYYNEEHKRCEDFVND